MTSEEFLVALQDVLETDDELTFDTVLEELDEWDSLAIMATMAFLSKNFQITLTMAEYKDLITVGDIAKKAGL